MTENLHRKINKPVFLKGKSSLLSMGEGRVYWQVGDVPPRGGELWSSDVWWEDLIKRRKYNDTDYVSMWFKFREIYHILSGYNNRKNLRIPEILVVDHRMIDSIDGRVLCWFAQQKLLEFLLHLCTGHCTCETKRVNQRDWGYPRVKSG